MEETMVKGAFAVMAGGLGSHWFRGMDEKSRGFFIGGFMLLGWALSGIAIVCAVLYVGYKLIRCFEPQIHSAVSRLDRRENRLEEEVRGALGSGMPDEIIEEQIDFIRKKYAQPGNRQP